MPVMVLQGIFDTSSRQVVLLDRAQDFVNSHYVVVVCTQYFDVIFGEIPLLYIAICWTLS